jgi:hypothetical protein
MQALSHMILQRLVKCVVSIAVQDWPKRWPEFLSSVASLSQVRDGPGRHILLFPTKMKELVINISSQILY